MFPQEQSVLMDLDFPAQSPDPNEIESQGMNR